MIVEVRDFDERLDGFAPDAGSVQHLANYGSRSISTTSCSILTEIGLIN